MKRAATGLVRTLGAHSGVWVLFLGLSGPGAAPVWARPDPPAETAEAPFAEFARRLETSLGVCQPDVLRESLALDLVLHRALRGLEVGSTTMQEVLQGVRQGMDFGSIVCQQVNAGGSYKLLRLREVDGRTRVLFRLLLSGGGLNYHDMMLTRLPGGEVKVIDVYIFLSGEWLSETLRRGLLPFVAQQKQGLLEKIFSKKENAYVASVGKIQEMMLHVQAGRFAEALAVYQELPPEVRRDKTVLLARMQAAQNVSEEAYGAALEDLKKTFPDDPAIGLTLIDYHFLREEFDAAFELVEAVDKAVGGDSYLHLMRANCRLGQGKLIEARQAASRAIRDEPELEDAYWTAVSASLGLKDYEDTAQLLDMLSDRLGIEIGDLTEIPEYAGFVASPAYWTWIEKRNQ